MMEKMKNFKNEELRIKNEEFGVTFSLVKSEE